MAISKSTPYVRYKKDFTSNLHLGTIHIESEYLDRTQKTTIESIHGMTWHNKVVNENKELNLLSDTQLELTELEKQYWNTGEKRVSVDEIHTLEEVEPNEDGTYTYTVNSMEGEYIEIYDGINNITSTSDGLDGQFEIVYDTTEEDINGNIVLDSIAPRYEITDSGVGAIIGAKSTGLTLVNNITEPSKEEVVAIEQQEGQYFTIENTVQGNIKSAILKGNTLVNLSEDNDYKTIDLTGISSYVPDFQNNVEQYKPNTKYLVITEFESALNSKFGVNVYNETTIFDKSIIIGSGYGNEGHKIYKHIVTTKSDFTGCNTTLRTVVYPNSENPNLKITYRTMIIEYQEGMENWDIPYFEGMQSVKMPVLTTTGKNLWRTDLFNSVNFEEYYKPTGYTLKRLCPDLVVGESYIASMNYQYTGSIDGAVGVVLLSPFTYLNDAFIYTEELGESLVYLYGGKVNGTMTNFQIEKGTVVTPFEEYKSNILTTNEEVELRGIGDVKDELNVLTGEIIERTSQGILNGTETWTRVSNSDRFYTRVNTLKKSETYNNLIIADKIRVEVGHNYDSFMNSPTNAMTGFTGITSHPNENWIYLKIIGIENVESLKAYLQQNPINYSYVLGEEIIKTVDLTVQNQDGNIIPHIQTQPTITHVSTSSDVLTPTVEMSCSYDTIIKPNTTYTIKLDRPIVSDTMYLQVDLGGTMMMLDADVNSFTIKTPSTLSHSQLRLSGVGNTVKEIIVLEGNRVNDKIEYFEGMKNVENPILVVSNCPYVFGKGGRL